VPAPVIPPAGVTPAGFFLPVKFAFSNTPIAMLADPIDPATGELLSIERGFDPVDAAVINALRTRRGSGSAVESVGQRFRDATHVTPQLASFMREEVRLALLSLSSSNQIRLESVEVVEGDDYADVIIEYVNVVRGEQRSVAVALGQLLGSPT